MALYKFGPFRLDEEARLLSRDGEPVVLTGKVFDTLAVLVRNHGRVLEKEQLLAAVWPGAIVEEANLTQNVSVLRKALGDSAKECRFVSTISGRGYAFVAPVIELPTGECQATPPSVEAQVASIPARRSLANTVGVRWLAVLLIVAGLSIGMGPSLRNWISGDPDRISSIAVMPFENLSNDSEQEFFAQGMTEQLITDLSKIRALRVISRTSSMQYKGKLTQSRSDIARELGADAIVEGSVMRSGGKVRVTARLIQARRNRYQWAESYSRNLTEALDVQREIAGAIAQQIRITITSNERAQLAFRQTVDPVVNDLVLRGQYYADRFTEAGLRKSAEYFEQAISIDPNYAPAHAGLAYVYRSSATTDMAPRKVMPKSKLEALRALELDETLADAHVSLAYALLFYDWDWPAAEKHVKRALELNPSAADAHLVYAGYFNALGRSHEALTEIRLAEALDPLSLPVQQMLLFSMVGARQYDRAIAQFQRTVEREPNFAAGYLLTALAHTEKGQMDQALDAVENARRIESNTTTQTIAAHVHAASGDRGKAEKLLKELSAPGNRNYTCPYEVAHAYVKLGDKKKAYEWLEKGKLDRADCMVWLLVEPWMDPLRGDQQYQKLIGYIGLATGKAGPKP